MVSVLGLVVVAAGQVKADVSTQFIVQGAYADGATLSGTVTIDTTVGEITAANLSVGAPDSLTLDNIIGQNGSSFSSWLVAVGTAGGALFPETILVIPSLTLVGYSGGPIASETYAPEGVGSALYYSESNTVILHNGELTPTPEPSTGLVASLGAAAFIGYGWSRRRRAQRRQAAA
jgi:hypothetical protein